MSQPFSASTSVRVEKSQHHYHNVSVRVFNRVETRIFASDVTDQDYLMTLDVDGFSIQFHGDLLDLRAMFDAALATTLQALAARSRVMNAAMDLGEDARQTYPG